MSYLEPTELPKAGPAMLIGAASPLWGYFGTAAMGGLAYWWMTRWMQPVNLEALFGRAWTRTAGAMEPARAAVELAPQVLAPAETAPEPPTPAFAAVGGESAPVSPVLEVAAQAPEAVLDAVVEAASESAETSFTALQTAMDPAPTVAPAARPAPELRIVGSSPEPTAAAPLAAAPAPKSKKSVPPPAPSFDA